MPVVRYNRAYFNEKLGFRVSNDELLRNISKMSLNMERESEDEIDLEYPANRPDLISTVGLTRAIRYFMRRSRKFNYELSPESKGFVINVGKNVSKIRPYIAGLVVRKMKLSDQDLLEIINFTEKLSETYGRKRERIALGLHDLKNVKPPFFYDAYEEEEYIPLNRQSPMSYSEVMKKEQKGIAYRTLGEKENRYVALKDTEGTISLIPILNSQRTKVTASTKDMLVDITGGSKYIIEKIADLLAADFLDMGYTVERIKVNYGGREYLLPKMESEQITMPLEQINQEIGVKVGFNNVILLANKMGYEAALVGTKINFKVPPYRLDVINEQDVIEDIAVAYGYDYIQPISIPSTQIGGLEVGTLEREKISDAMVGLGFNEMLNSYLTNEETNFKRMRLEQNNEYVTIANPKTETLTMLRTWLLPSLLSNLAKSMKERLPINIFELDMAFNLKVNVPDERYHLAAVCCDSRANFNDIKATLEGLSNKLGIAIELKKGAHKSFIEGRCAEIALNKRNIGFLGEIHPEVLASFRIEEPVIGFEIDISELPNAK